MFRRPPVVAAPAEPVAPTAVPPDLGTTTWVPSVRGAARFNPDRSALGFAPPARSTASITRSPCPNAYTPGARTHPVTSTMIGGPVGEAPPAGAAPLAATGDAAIATRFGRERRY